MRFRNNGTINVALTAGEPDNPEVHTEISIEDNLYGVLFGIECTLECATGDPGYGAGATADYDTLIDQLVFFRRIRMIVDGSYNKINYRSDFVAFMDAVFRPEAWNMDVLPVAVTGATHYDSSWFIPMKCPKNKGKYRVEIDTNTEANMYTTVANAVLTLLTYYFINIYETFEYSVKIESFMSELIDNATGIKVVNQPTEDLALVGIVVAGEQEGTEDLTGAIVRHEGYDVYRIRKRTFEAENNHNSHGKVLHQNYCNMLFLIFNRTLIWNKTSEFQLLTSASQDFQIAYIYVDEVDANLFLSEETIPVKGSQPVINIGGNQVSIPAEYVMTYARGHEKSVGVSKK